jgi:hypothetical protein
MIAGARPLLIALAAGGVCGAFAGRAQAAPATARLETANAPGAGDCPDAAKLAASVNEGLGRPALATAGAATQSPRRIAVSFERAGSAYAATVQISGAQGGTRKLSNAGPGCRALADAVGMLLVLVLDSNDDAAAAAPPAPASGSNTVPEATSASGATRATGSALTAAVGAGGGVAEGLVGGWSPAVGLGGTLTSGALSARLGGFWLPAKSHEIGSGRVEIGLAAARLALCATAHRDRAEVGLGLCVQQQTGWIRGRGVDYDDNRTVGHSWLATGAAIVVNGPLGRTVGWEIEAGVVRVWQEIRFLVGDFGTAFQTPPAAFMMTLSFTTKVW